MIQKLKEENKKLSKELNLLNKKETDKATKHINDVIDQYSEEFYKIKKDKNNDLER